MKPFRDPSEVLARTTLVESFLEFVRIDTTSDPASGTVPSTARQFDLQHLLVPRLVALGCREARLDEKGYLYAVFPGNRKTPPIGLMAHVDTTCDFPGAGVRPLRHADYAGGPIALPAGIAITPEENPELAQCVGDTILTSSGDTILGADDKAGIAEILAALEILAADPSLPRPTLKIAFTPDEEIGGGARNFDVDGFGAACAYTVDGGFAGEVNVETFSADKAEVTVTGVAVHPGYAKGKLVNALRFLGRFLDRLPGDESPEATDGRAGFFHPIAVRGNAAEATAELILRDFDDSVLAERGRRLREWADALAAEDPRLTVKVEIKEQYRNMVHGLAGKPKVREHLVAAVRDAGIEPRLLPIRGGTDGSGLTAMGLPTPNVFTGGRNAHGPREWVSDRVMALAVCTLLNLVQRWGEDPG
jgi:tripeptide aminopeptidase